MNAKAKELEELIANYKTNFSKIDDSLAQRRVSDDEWTMNEIVGHLIDSASNNHQRFVRLQFADNLEFPNYNNEEWLKVQNYQSMKFSELFGLFISFNKLIVNVIKSIDKNCYKNKWIVDWDKKTKSITLEDLVEHYIRHLRNHLEQLKEHSSELDSFVNQQIS